MIIGRPSLWRMQGKLMLGERVTIHSFPPAYLFGQEFPRCVFSSYPRGTIEIGDDTFIAGSVLFAMNRISIGKRVRIAAGCRIIDHDGHPVDVIPRNDGIPQEHLPVTIEDDVWLCSEVMVCKGVRIGKGSVIGAKSLVTHDVPSMSLAAGVPAKVIRPITPLEQESHILQVD